MPMEIIDEGDGWKRWLPRHEGRFIDLIGPFSFRELADGSVECRMETSLRHANGLGFLHGGYLMAYIDMALFAIARPKLAPGTGGVTLTCNTEFLGGGIPGEPIYAQGEVLRETGKMLFLRGIVHQRDERVCAFSATLRKVQHKK